MRDVVTPKAAGTAPGAEPRGGSVEVSVVLPCLDEERGVGECVRTALGAMAAMGVSGEVVVVDNGSTDRSAELAAEAGARVVHEPRRGYGSAYLRGFEEARGRFLVMADADTTYDLEDLPRFVEPLTRGECDLVMGNRLGGEIRPGAMPWTHRWIGNPVLSGMLRLLFRTRIADAHCGMRGITREAYRRLGLRTTGMELASEMVVSALREGLVIHEIPIAYHPREGESKLSGVRDAWRHVRFMLLYSPSYLFQLPGLVLMAVGAFLVLALAGGPRVLFGHRWDYHPLLFGAIAVIVGYQLVLFDTFAKTFSLGAGLARPGPWIRAFFRLFSLERGLAVGALVFLAGLGLEVKIVLDWLEAGGGELMAVRGVVIGMAAMVLGVETLFGSFLISLMLIPRR